MHAGRAAGHWPDQAAPPLPRGVEVWSSAENAGGGGMEVAVPERAA